MIEIKENYYYSAFGLICDEVEQLQMNRKHELSIDRSNFSFVKTNFDV